MSKSTTIFIAFLSLLFLPLLSTGCTTTKSEEEEFPDRNLSEIKVTAPREGAQDVERLPTFAWQIPRRPNRVSTIIFNLFREDEIEKDARFIRVFDGPIERFRLNEGQAGMPASGIGQLEAATRYVWRLTISYEDVDLIHTGEWRFTTAP